MLPTHAGHVPCLALRCHGVLCFDLLKHAVLALQVCTGVMLHGYGLVKQLCGELQV